MIETWQAIILALIQGLTEFLPISSSGHLILPSELLGWNDQGLAFDVAVHFGSVLAVLFYFRTQVKEIAIGGLMSITGRWTDQGKIAWLLVLATLPAGLAGFIFNDYVEGNLRGTQTIAVMTLIGAFLLAFADKTKQKNKTLTDMTWKLALAIGMAQAIALIPGTSRSGITMTLALILGFQRVPAAQFSFLMSIPVIMFSAGWKALVLMSTENASYSSETSPDGVPWGQILLGIIVSGVSAYICIQFFLKFIERIGFMPFVVYRVLLGLGLIALIIW